jgi:hypothetical protein
MAPLKEHSTLKTPLACVLNKGFFFGEISIFSRIVTYECKTEAARLPGGDEEQQTI